MITLWEPIKLTIDVLRKEGYADELGLHDSTQSELAMLLNRHRDARKIPARVHVPRLSSDLKEAAKGNHLPLLDEISEALCLNQFGLDSSLWYRPASEIPSLTKSALNGGVLATLSSLPMSQSLLSVHTRIDHGLESLVDEHTPIFEFPETAVTAGNEIVLKLVMPFAGFIRVFASERGNYFLMNEQLGLPMNCIDEDAIYTKPQLTTSHVSRTIFLALAATENFFDRWHSENEEFFHPSPGNDLRTIRDGQLLQLVTQFAAQAPSDRAISVHSMITRC